MRKITRWAGQTEMYSTKAANGSQCLEDVIREVLGARQTATSHQRCYCVTTRRHQQLQTQTTFQDGIWYCDAGIATNVLEACEHHVTIHCQMKERLVEADGLWIAAPII